MKKTIAVAKSIKMMKNRTIIQKELCFECSDVESDSTCQECQKVYCSSCFDFVHQGRIMRTHKLIEPEKCVEEEPWQFGYMQTFIDSTTRGIEVSKYYLSTLIKSTYFLYSNSCGIKECGKILITFHYFPISSMTRDGNFFLNTN